MSDTAIQEKSIDDMVYKIYPRYESTAAKIAKIPFYPILGIKDFYSDTVKLGVEAKKKESSTLGSLATYYGSTIAGNAIATVPLRAMQYGLAEITNTTLTSPMWYPYPLVLAGPQYVSGTAAGITATATIPYILPVAAGIHYMIKGAKEKNLVKMGIGSGMAGIPLANAFGDYAIASKALLGGVLKTSASYFTTLGISLLLGGAVYKAGKKVYKWFYDAKQRRQERKAEAHAPAVAPA